MKRFVFFVSLVLAIALFINILNILIIDFNRLNEYGYGYLAGEIILLILLLFLVFFTRKKKSIN